MSITSNLRLEQQTLMASPKSVLLMSVSPRRSPVKLAKLTVGDLTSDSSNERKHPCGESPRKRAQILKERFHSPSIRTIRDSVSRQDGERTVPPPPLAEDDTNKDSYSTRVLEAKTTLKGIVPNSPFTPTYQKKKLVIDPGSIGRSTRSHARPKGHLSEKSPDATPAWPVKSQAAMSDSLSSPVPEKRSIKQISRLKLTDIRSSPQKASARAKVIGVLPSSNSPLKSAFRRRISSTLGRTKKKVRFDVCSTRVFDRNSAPRAVARGITRHTTLLPVVRRPLPSSTNDNGCTTGSHSLPSCSPSSPSHPRNHRLTPASPLPPPPPLVGCRKVTSTTDPQLLSTIRQSKVFAMRMEKKVLKIQASARGYMQRLRYTDLQSHANNEQMERVRNDHETQAAAKLQAMVRGYFGRLMGRIAQLEKHLEQVEADHLHELANIEQEKQRKMAEWLELYTANIRQADDELDNQVKVQTKEIRMMREQNKNLRQSNRSLARDGCGLYESNQQLEVSSKELEKEMDRVRETIRSLGHSRDQWTTVNDMYHDRVNRFEFANDELERMIGMEKHANVVLQSTMVKVLETLEMAQRNNPDESELFQDALAIAADAPWNVQTTAQTLLSVSDSCLDVDFDSPEEEKNEQSVILPQTIPVSAGSQ